MLRDYYSILGVSPFASHAEIRQAYRRLAVKYHPDKNPDPAVADLFKEINEAYGVIGVRTSVKRTIIGDSARLETYFSRNRRVDHTVTPPTIDAGSHGERLRRKRTPVF